jgi:hypothetical protein
MLISGMVPMIGTDITKCVLSWSSCSPAVSTIKQMKPDPTFFFSSTSLRLAQSDRPVSNSLVYRGLRPLLSIILLFLGSPTIPAIDNTAQIGDFTMRVPMAIKVAIQNVVHWESGASDTNLVFFAWQSNALLCAEFCDVPVEKMITSFENHDFNGCSSVTARYDQKYYYKNYNRFLRWTNTEGMNFKTNSLVLGDQGSLETYVYPFFAFGLQVTEPCCLTWPTGTNFFAKNKTSGWEVEGLVDKYDSSGRIAQIFYTNSNSGIRSTQKQLTADYFGDLLFEYDPHFATPAWFPNTWTQNRRSIRTKPHFLQIVRHIYLMQATTNQYDEAYFTLSPDSFADVAYTGMASNKFLVLNSIDTNQHQTALILDIPYRTKTTARARALAIILFFIMLCIPALIFWIQRMHPKSKLK